MWKRGELNKLWEGYHLLMDELWDSSSDDNRKYLDKELKNWGYKMITKQNMKMLKRYWVIKKPNEELVRNSRNQIEFFEYPEQAMRYINRVLGGSSYLEIEEWKNE